MKMRLITISDVVLGYGSPQIKDFSEALCEVLGSTGLICQPLVPQRKLIHFDSCLLNLETFHTADHPHGAVGRIEYKKKCANLINQYKPDVLVISNYSLLSLLDQLEYRPKKIIHLVLEDMDSLQGSLSNTTQMTMIRRLVRNNTISLWVFPEANRARHDAELFNIDPTKISIFYNLSNRNKFELTKSERIPRIIYAGTLDVDTSVGEIIFDEELAHFPLDVYGDLQGNEASKTNMQQKIKNLRRLGSQKNQQKWFGQVPGRTLNDLLPVYSFSLVYWKPVRHALLNAAPNKFFEAVAAGVPVISAPHPQMKVLIQRYGCGLLLEGWDKDHLTSSLRKAERLLGTMEYEELRTNCSLAVKTELSWQTQMKKWVDRFNVKDW